MKIKFLSTILLLLLMPFVMMAGVRKTMNLSEWSFSRDGRQWKNVSVPHDWAISGPFDKKWDLQKVAIVQNGETQKTEKSGRTGALPWLGKGFYKTTIQIPRGTGKAELVFDGAMSEPVVLVNGKEAGRWAYGYNAFRVDITSFVKPGENEVEVRLTNVEESSRWYPGGGLYRPVQLILTGETRISDWDCVFRTLSLNGRRTNLFIESGIAGRKPQEPAAVEFILADEKGHTVVAHHCVVNTDGKASVEFPLDNVNLWTPRTPYLYTLHTRLYLNGRLADVYSQKVGIRTVAVNATGGFMLNGTTLKLKGVCLHHDLGPLGAAVNKAVLARQLRIMKNMGCNAIRTAHNMPSTWQMELCDSMGMMVMAESFDMWEYPKCQNGYARFFDDWSEKDIENLVKNHRNHPSIVMWSIGNEIPEQGSERGATLSKRLQDICHKLDSTRPVTQGFDRVDDAFKAGTMSGMDVPGFNYRVHKYDELFPKLLQGFLLGSETASTVSSRGTYLFPVKLSDSELTADGQCTSYDTRYCYWSNVPDIDFMMEDDRPWMIGQFVWTGFDYLGEPTPYDTYWPSRSSYFGICDLAGLPKDRYYLYRSKWNTDSVTIHLLPHWTWPGREGKVTPVYCYTNYPTAELFVNGKSQGKITKHAVWQGDAKTPDLDRYRLRWNNVKYEAGELKVVVYDAKGRQVGERILRTAQKPAHIKLTADRTTLFANGDDMAFVTVSLTDANGVECPTSSDELTFEVEGVGNYEAACNGDATSLETFTAPRMKLFNGKLVLLVRTSRTPGDIKVTVKNATHPNMSPSTLKLVSR